MESDISLQFKFTRIDHRGHHHPVCGMEWLFPKAAIYKTSAIARISGGTRVGPPRLELAPYFST